MTKFEKLVLKILTLQSGLMLLVVSNTAGMRMPEMEEILSLTKQWHNLAVLISDATRETTTYPQGDAPQGDR